MIIHDKYRELGGVRRFRPTGKELPPHGNYKEQAWYVLAGWIEEQFGPEGGTASEVYHEVTGPKMLSADTTMELLKAAKAGGYLK